MSKPKKINFFFKILSKPYNFSDWDQITWGVSEPYSMGSSSKEFLAKTLKVDRVVFFDFNNTVVYDNIFIFKINNLIRATLW